MSVAKDFTKGSLLKSILFISIPLMLSNVLQVLFNMADVAIVGRFAGDIALGGVGSTTTIVNIFIGFLMGVGGGISACVARNFGSGREDRIEKTVHNSLIIAVAVGVVLMAIGLIFGRGLLEIMGTKPEFIDGAALYLNIFFIGIPSIAIYNFGNGVLSAIGDTKRPLAFLAISGAVNVILNLFFVIVCDLHVAGVAIATTVSQTLSAALVLITLFRSKQSFGLRVKKLRFAWSSAKEIIAISLSAGLQNALFHLSNLFIQAGVNTFDKTVVNGTVAAANSDALVYDLMAAFYTAGTAFVGQNYGAGNRKRVLQSYFISTAYAFGAGLILGGLLLIFSRQFLGMFTASEEIIDAGLVRLRIMACSYAFSAFMDGTIAASRGIGKTVIPTIAVIMGACVFRIIWMYTVFAWFGTIESIYFLYIFSWTITALFEIVYFAIQYKKTARILDECATDSAS